MKRLVLAGCALLLLCAITTYHAVPLLYKEPLLWLNRNLSGLEEKTVQAAGHRIHYLEGGAALALTGVLLLFILQALERARRRTLVRETRA